jgi:hypothetical protein
MAGQECLPYNALHVPHRRLKPSLKDVLNKDPNGIPAGNPRNSTALSRQVLADLVENGEASFSSAKPAKSEIRD